MCDGRLKSIWDPTSVVLAMIANVNRDPEKQPDPYLPKDFNPYRRDDVTGEENNEPLSCSGFWQRVANLRVFNQESQGAALKSMLEGMRSNVGSDS